MAQRTGFKLIVVCQLCGQKNSAFYYLLRKTNCGRCHEPLLRSEHPQGFVYLLRSGYYYKIGKANDLKKRISQIKLQLPFDVELVHAIEAFHPYKVEQHWHKKFIDKRRNGEWFVLTDEEVAEFKRVESKEIPDFYVTSVKYALVFALFGLVCAFFALTSNPVLVRLLAASFAIAFTGVGLAYAFIGQRAFFKQPNGRLHPLSYLLYWPYHLLNAASLWGFRRSARENAFDKIADNVYLGCRLCRRDEPTLRQLGIKSVLDLTCEFSEIPLLRGLSYFCIPTLDTRAPSMDQLQNGARWIQQEAANGPVYIHCALGHGRSATFVAAYLLLYGKARTSQDAIEHIKTLRPRIGLHPEQLALLEQLASLPHEIDRAT